MDVSKHRFGLVDDSRFGIFLRWHGPHQERSKYDDDVYGDNWHRKHHLGDLRI